MTLLIRFLLLWALPASVWASILVYPKSLDLGARERSGAVTLVNNGAEDITIRVSWVERMMKDDGTLEPVTAELAPWRASPMLRHSPRQVVVPAGGSQVVRVLYRRPETLAAGEYRSHLVFQQLPSTKALGSSDDNAVSVQITTILGLSVPVFVREGAPNATLRCGAVRLLPPEKEGEGPRLDVLLERSGNVSARGSTRVFQRQADGGWKALTPSQSLIVYAEKSSRHVNVKLPPGNYAPASLMLRYQASAKEAREPVEPIDCALP